jgi:hypothetical protein
MHEKFKENKKQLKRFHKINIFLCSVQDMVRRAVLCGNFAPIGKSASTAKNRQN